MIGVDRLANDSSLGVADKGEELGYAGLLTELSRKAFNDLGEIEVLFQEEFFVGCAQGFDVLVGESPALQSDLVDAADRCGIAIDDGERWDILHDFGAASDDGMLSDAAKLMGAGEPGNDDIILHDGMAAKGPVIGEDDVITDLAIVRDV